MIEKLQLVIFCMKAGTCIIKEIRTPRCAVAAKIPPRVSPINEVDTFFIK